MSPRADRITLGSRIGIYGRYSDSNQAIKQLLVHGMTRKEAENYVNRRKLIRDYLEENRGNVCYTRFKGKMITYGRK